MSATATTSPTRCCSRATAGRRTASLTPEGYEPKPEIVAEASDIARETGGRSNSCTDPNRPSAGADAVYTDAWASMGQEHEANARPVFKPYQVNEKLMAARRRMPCSCTVCRRIAAWKSPTRSWIRRSVVFDQAENRLHVQKAILCVLLWRQCVAAPGKECSCLREIPMAEKLCSHIPVGSIPRSSFRG